MSAPIVQCERLGKRYQHSAPARAPAVRRAARRHRRRRSGAVPSLSGRRGAVRDRGFLGAARRVVRGRRRARWSASSAATAPARARCSRSSAASPSRPTAASTLRGRVASLLEVGTGFHPELTGRENIFLNGAILGMTPRRDRRASSTRSSRSRRSSSSSTRRSSATRRGMYVRLAFAVAAHLEPEILIVDEVLAVGDAEFQKKCLGKMHDVAAAAARCCSSATTWRRSRRCAAARSGSIAARVAADGGAADTIAAYLAASRRRGGRRPAAPYRLGAALDLRRFELTPNPLTSGGQRRISRSSFWRATPRRSTDLALLIYSPLEVAARDSSTCGRLASR